MKKLSVGILSRHFIPKGGSLPAPRGPQRKGNNAALGLDVRAMAAVAAKLPSIAFLFLRIVRTPIVFIVIEILTLSEYTSQIPGIYKPFSHQVAEC
jgi:hypothetical protein